MHEMSLVLRIIDIATEEAQRKDAKKITKIELILGELSGVLYESLMFSFELACKGTMLENAKIVVERIVGQGQCHDCYHVYKMKSLLDKCPKCSALNPKVIQGREFQVRSINVV